MLSHVIYTFDVLTLTLIYSISTKRDLSCAILRDVENALNQEKALELTILPIRRSYLSYVRILIVSKDLQDKQD